MSEKLKIVNLASRRNAEEDKSKEAWKKELKKTFERVQKAIDEDRLTQFILSFDETTTEEEKANDDKDFSSMVLTWNADGDTDKTLGNIARLHLRYLLLVEGLIE